MHRFSRIHCSMCRTAFEGLLCDRWNDDPSKCCVECKATPQTRGTFRMDSHVCRNCYGTASYAMLDRYVQDELRAYIAAAPLLDTYDAAAFQQGAKEIRSQFTLWLFKQPFWKNDIYTIEALLNIVDPSTTVFVEYLESVWHTANVLGDK